MNIIQKIALASLLFGTLAACGEPPEGTLIQGCEPKGAMRALCGMQAPEDIAVVPGGDFLLLSELGMMGERPGRALFLNVNDEQWWPAYPLEDTPTSSTAVADPQGSASCVTPPTNEMSPHGSHLLTLDNGKVRYLLVNHGDREAVELFDVAVAEGPDAKPELEWVGCVLPADNTMINDVVGLANGDVVYTRMFRPGDFLGQVRGMVFTSGDVWRWSKSTGPRLLPDTAGRLTNGIEISPDERFVFINQYMNKEVHKYDLQEESIAGVAAVPNADNSAWGPNGELWLASHSDNLTEMRACFADQSVTCGMHFDIVALNPETMATRTLFSHQGPPMGAATVATYNRDKVYLGSFLGDRLAIVPFSEFAAD